MPKKGGFFVNATYHLGEKDPARVRGEAPSRLDYQEVAHLHRLAKRKEIDVDGMLAKMGEKKPIPDDVHRFVRAVLEEGISPHTPRNGRPRKDIIREAAEVIDALAFEFAVERYQGGKKDRHVGVKLADYDVVDSDFDEV